MKDIEEDCDKITVAILVVLAGLTGFFLVVTVISQVKMWLQ